MATKYAFARDINGFNGFGLVASDHNYSATLAATTDTTLDVPDESSIGGAAYYDKPPINFVQQNGEPILVAEIITQPASKVWFAVNGTAAVPAGATFAATTSVLIPPSQRFTCQVNGGDVLHFYSTAATVDVSVRFYWMN